MKYLIMTLCMTLAMLLAGNEPSQAFPIISESVPFAEDALTLDTVYHGVASLVIIIEEGEPDPVDSGENVASIHFEYDLDINAQVTLVAEQIAGLIVLNNTSFEAVNDNDLTGLSLLDTTMASGLASGDVLILLTTDNRYLKLGNITVLADGSIEFDYQQLQMPLTTVRVVQPIAAPDISVPEPSTMLLLGSGLIALFGVARRYAGKRRR